MSRITLDSHWLKNLNPEQREAVAHDTGPLLILAGAGSGKTTVLVSRAGRLIDEKVVDPARLCVLTFTNKAARELKSRVAAKLGDKGSELWAGTFHSFGLQLLRKHARSARLNPHFSILDPKDTSGMVKELMSDFKHDEKDAFDANLLMAQISEWRERGQTEATKEEPYEEAVEWLLPRYLKRLEHLGAVDFDSLILLPWELMKSDPKLADEVRRDYDQIMVDEFQDTNTMQMRLVKILAEPHRNLAVVGDDDQSIYGWRGANIQNILNFPQLYTGCKVIRLERNYRSTPRILNLANTIIEANPQRHKKVLRPRDGIPDGEMPQVYVAQDENHEAEFLTGEVQSFKARGYRLKDIALLYRSNSIGAFIEAELRKNHIPYEMSGGTAFFDRKETRDVLAYLRCAVRPSDVPLRRILNTPNRGIGEKTFDRLNNITFDHEQPLLKVCRHWAQWSIDPKAGHSMDRLFQVLGELKKQLIEPSSLSAGTRLIQLLEEIGYRGHLERHSKDAMTAGRRWKYVAILGEVLDRYVERGGRTLKTFLEFLDGMELRDNPDTKDEKEDALQLLTLHACKGLEFPVVFLVGIEEELLPHRTLGTDVAEERRLFYVGVTRAKEHLILTRASKRRRFGKWQDTVPSRFLMEIPKGYYANHSGPRPVTQERRRALIDDLYKKLDALEPKA